MTPSAKPTREPTEGLELEIERPAVGGLMIARHEGRVVLVRGAIPGERVRVQIGPARHGVLHGETVGVVTPHPDRRSVAGDPACGGNVFAHMAYPRQLQIKQAIVEDAFWRIGKRRLPAPVEIASSPETGYRLRARLHVSGGRVGFMRLGTRQVCDPSATGQLLPATCRVVAQVGEALARADAPRITAIEVAENLRADQRVLHVWLRGPAVDALPWLRGLGAEGVTGLSASRRPGARAVVVGRPIVEDRLPAGGSGPLGDQPGSVVIRRHATTFFQGNRYLLSALVSRVVEAIPPGPVFDLYAGVGLFGIAAAIGGRGPVTAVEADPGNVADLRASVAASATEVRVWQATVERFLGRGAATTARHATVVVDPPRVGLPAEVGRRLAALRPSRLVYVSCDVATLARDVGRLAAAGYALDSLEGFDLFPNTAHLELVAVLTPSG